ncbi:MAG: hypothetical protein RIG61_05885 [Deltaproteobacteria bacterium]
MFEVPPNTEKYVSVKDAILEVWRFDIAPGSDGKEFIYRISDLEYKSDFYNQFFRPPTALLTDVTTRYLAGSGLFMDVLSPTSQGGNTNYYIEGNIVRLYGDYRTQPKAVMEIQLFLLKYESDITDGGISNIVFGKTYSSEKPIASASAQDLMRGWNLALEEILNEFLADLSGKVNQKPGI